MFKLDVSFLLVLIIFLAVGVELQSRGHREVVGNAATTQVIQSEPPGPCNGILPPPPNRWTER